MRKVVIAGIASALLTGGLSVAMAPLASASGDGGRGGEPLFHCTNDYDPIGVIIVPASEKHSYEANGWTCTKAAGGEGGPAPS